MLAHTHARLSARVCEMMSTSQRNYTQRPSPSKYCMLYSSIVLYMRDHKLLNMMRRSRKMRAVRRAKSLTPSECECVRACAIPSQRRRRQPHTASSSQHAIMIYIFRNISRRRHDAAHARCGDSSTTRVRATAKLCTHARARACLRKRYIIFKFAAHFFRSARWRVGTLRRVRAKPARSSN